MDCFVSNNYEKGLIYLFFNLKKKGWNYSLFNGSKAYFWVMLSKNVFVELPILV